MSGPRPLFLCGFSGSGKSTVGPILARMLNLRFVDLDHVITKRAGRSIEQIFAEYGERRFRVLERQEIMRRIMTGKRPAVVALGGGALHNNEVIQLLKRSGILIYLSCSVREIYRRLKQHSDRPMLANSAISGREEIMSRISGLLTKRKPKYCQADLRVSTTNKTPRKVVQIIKAGLARNYDFI